ncbi:apiosidase-like domain-containing protein [Paenibacillus mendelii]|uniref:DUF4038 domain-containing protein n=1 Tax=Paenibacillus mendelii TaxID=206163 RepID=A0ABV6JEJ6_9BACL|nr:DUF4038 domain-containing protein [Paenibacillus mendelii]MCQ6557214.1 DUF4038 domain-containing protein [Paenibacillus mendelii]
MINNVKQNNVVEWTFQSEKSYSEPFHEIRFEAVVTGPDGKERRLPGFWAGKGQWKLRYSSSQIGEHQFRTVCSDENDLGLHGQSGRVQIEPYNGDNPLYKHGAVRASDCRSYLKHEDGTPFFWLADTWWMSLTKRLQWPEDFKWLTQDRVEKGFTAIQLVAGLYPDMAPFDERGAAEGGQAWETDFQRINPAFFDTADAKIEWLVESGLMPCMVACWGYYLDFAGKENIKKHWEYLVARYGAYPVVWCIAGEATMPYYQWDSFSDSDLKKPYVERLRKEWTEIANFIGSIDPFQRALTIHPTEYGHDMVEDASVLDLDMLQTGHSGILTVGNTVRKVRDSVAREPKTPVINSEVCYEGIGGTSFQEVQRMLFWNCMLNGACGHTYGANGIWQVNDEKQPYGASPTGIAWGHTFWKEAAQLPGSRQVGIGKKLLENYRWWEFQPHPEWVNPVLEETDVYSRVYAAGITGEVRVIYAPMHLAFSGVTVRELEDVIPYRAYAFDPATADVYDMGRIQVNKDGTWSSGRLKIFQDWVLVIERIQ